MEEQHTTTVGASADPSALMKQMFEVGAQYGYKRSRRHPSVAPFIYGVKNQVEIFDLERTAELLAAPLAFVAKIAGEGKKILFVGTKHEAQEAVRELASFIDMPWVCVRWIGGTLTNFPEIRSRVARLEELRGQRESGDLAAKYTKKERLLIDHEINRLEKNFSGIISMKEKPAALFVVDPGKEHTAVKEARQLGIPVIGLASSDCDIRGIEFPLIANDSSRASIFFFMRQIVNAYRKGRNEKPL